MSYRDTDLFIFSLNLYSQQSDFNVSMAAFSVNFSIL